MSVYSAIILSVKTNKKSDFSTDFPMIVDHDLLPGLIIEFEKYYGTGNVQMKVINNEPQ